MTAKPSLARLQRHKVEQIRERLAGLETMRAELLARRDQLDETLDRERVRSKDSHIGRVAFPTFVKSVRDRQANLQRSAGELVDQIHEAREELAAALKELQTFENSERAEQERKGAVSAVAPAAPAVVEPLPAEGRQRTAAQ
jgi:chromosome segregation ATPase